MTDKPHILLRPFIFLWRTLNFIRTAIFNLIFFLILTIIIVGVNSDDFAVTDEITIPYQSALLLNIEGNLVEEKRYMTGSQFFQQLKGHSAESETLLADVIKAIEIATDDQRIKALVLDLSYMRNASIDKLTLIGKYLEDFKSSGKKVYAVGDYFTQNQYLLASYADEIVLTTNGWISIDGFASYHLYFKEAIEKLKITAHIFRVGTFKSAVEPYIRNNMSDEAKEANQLWLSQLWDIYQNIVTSNRQIDASSLPASAEDLNEKLQSVGFDFNEYAIKYKLVDAIESRQEQMDRIASEVGYFEHKSSYRYIKFDRYLMANKGPSVLGISLKSSKVAVVPVSGVIRSGYTMPGTAGSDSVIEKLRQARTDDNVKAVVIRINSPGGSAFASELIRAEIDQIKAAGKPVVVSMGAIAASGGYWISASADEIWASPSTITGSIGVFGMMATFENSLAELGIHTDGVGSSDLAGLSPMRSLSPAMKQIFQGSVNSSYSKFLTLVASNRNMTVEAVDKVAQGRVWTGIKAQEFGLVDKLGSLDDAIEAAADKASLQLYDVTYIHQKLPLFEQFMADTLKKSYVWLYGEPAVDSGQFSIAGQASQLQQKVLGHWQQLQALNDPDGIYVLCSTCSYQ